MAEFPALPLWTDAYLGDTTHLDVIEHGAYLLLLITAWRSRDCALPDDNKLLARYARCTAAQWKKLRPIIEPFFEIKNEKWTQGRLTDEFDAVRKRREIAASNGRASALKRQGRHSAKREQSESDSESDASAERELEGQREGQRKSNLTNTSNKPLLSPLDEKGAKRSQAKPKIEIPEDWEPKDFGADSQSRAIVDGWTPLEFQRQIERFVAHHRKEGSRFSDWQAAWSTWVLNSPGFSGDRRGGPSAQAGGSFVDIVLSEHQPRAARP